MYIIHRTTSTLVVMGATLVEAPSAAVASRVEASMGSVALDMGFKARTQGFRVLWV